MRIDFFETVNPFSLETIAKHAYATNEQIESCLQKAYLAWKKDAADIGERKKTLYNIAQALQRDRQSLAVTMALEMGKPITQGLKEIEKCVSTCEYLAEQAENFLQEQKIKAHYPQTFIQKEALGPVLAIMPWNYPAWQVIRVLAPQVLIGNPVILKHADLVAGFSEVFVSCVASALEDKDFFQNLHFDHGQTERVIADSRIRGVTFTGSVSAGSKIGGFAGKHLKKCVLELGGSDPYIVLADADLDLTAKILAQARMVNNGQSCIAAKRFLISKTVKQPLLERLILEFGAYPNGNPIEKSTVRGPLAAKRFQVEMQQQVSALKKRGAQSLWSSEVGGTFETNAFCGIELLDCPLDFPVLKDLELFVPVACVQSFDQDDEAVRLANATDFGLGAALFTKDLERAKRIASHLEAGMVAVNAAVASDVRTPFGGVKHSGFGRELGEQGVLEFARWKTLGMA